MMIKDDVFFLIKHLSKCVELTFDKEANKLGLTPQQGRLLSFLVRKKSINEEVRQIDIEERFDLSKSTVSGLVKRMECKKLIYKEKNKNKIIILPTEEGEELIKTFKLKIDSIKQNIIKDLSEEEKEEMIMILNKVLENLKKEGEAHV